MDELKLRDPVPSTVQSIPSYVLGEKCRHHACWDMVANLTYQEMCELLQSLGDSQRVSTVRYRCLAPICRKERRLQ